MAPKTFASLFSVPELNRYLGQYIGADNAGLCQQARLSLGNRSLAGRRSVRLWCLHRLWRWQWHPWHHRVAPIQCYACHLEVPVDPRTEFPFGW